MQRTLTIMKKITANVVGDVAGDVCSWRCEQLEM